jgi:thiol:disulfide interchange protein DsbD
LNTVKVSLGLLELALALKFFSVVDMAYHWGILKREIFLALWIIIFGLLGIYLIGGFKLSHDSDGQPKLSVMRLAFAIISLSFAMYMIPGLWGAPTKLLSGLAPPTNYKEWNPTDCPHGIDCTHDYSEGIERAKRENKPVLIDFTGYACVNCRKMEDNVWSDPRILEKLENDYVVISLYVDDKTPLPPSLQTKSYRTGEVLKTYGAKWSDFQAHFFKANTQPQYILLDANGKMLAAPKSYTPDINEYNLFLEEGICRFNK